LGQQKLVDFLLIGSTKAGTSTLYSLFSKHKQIVTGREKEPHYFCKGVFGPNYLGFAREIQSEEEYDDNFDSSDPDRLRGDFDPHTLHGPHAPEMIARANPRAKVLAILRNPIDRSYSHYLMDVRECAENRPFIHALKAEYQLYMRGSPEYCRLIRLGFYAKQIQGFQKALGPDNVKAWLYDDFVDHPADVLRQLCAFIGIDFEGLPPLGSIRENEAGVPANRFVVALFSLRYGILRGPRNLYVKLPLWFRRYVRNRFLIKAMTTPPLETETREYLRDVYKDDILQLEKVIGRDLAHWLRDPLNPASLPTDVQKTKQAQFFDEAVDDEFEIERPHNTGRLYRWGIHKKFAMAARMLSFPLKGCTMLEICCGSGMGAEIYSKWGANVTGLDLSTHAVARARARARRHGFETNFATGDAEAIDFPDQSFDIVTVHDGLHHLPNPYLAIAEMARVARKAIIVIEPARSWLTQQAVAAGLAEDFEDAGNYVYRFREDEIFAIARTAGFARHEYSQYFLYYKHEPFKWAARYVDRTPLFYLFPMFFGLATVLAPRLGNKICVVCERAE